MALFVELYVALLQREERVIAANADIVARMEARTALSDDNGADLCMLAWVTNMCIVQIVHVEVEQKKTDRKDIFMWGKEMRRAVDMSVSAALRLRLL